MVRRGAGSTRSLRNARSTKTYIQSPQEKAHKPMTSEQTNQQLNWRGHKPVLCDAVIRLLDPLPGKVFFDGTLGGAGHTKLLIERGAFVFATDRDPEAIAHAKKKLAKFADSVELRHESFDETYFNPQSLDGILIDLGVSSHQLESPHRGFSFQHDGPLDMRMDTTRGPSASEILANSTDAELAKILLATDHSPHMRALARALIKERRHTRFETTRQLAAWVEKFEGYRWHRTHHPATLLFQALRVAVNQELERLDKFLRSAPSALKPGGVMAVITFHSGEDRVVKKHFEELTRPWLDTPAWPSTFPNPRCIAELLTKKTITPDTQELQANPRARSAKLRAIRRLGNQTEPNL
jgi:16S rRNA (cytosine1402-N4)-methyltransferase